MTKSYRPPNIRQLYVIKLSKWFMLTMPIVFLFYQENGLGAQELFILKAAYSLVIVALEIPSGYIADIWGRKNAIIIGSLLGTAGFGIYCFSSGFYGFLIAELILGIGQSFISGSDSALLYDSLQISKQDNNYLRIEGRLISLGNYAEAIAAPVGVALAAASLRTPWIFQTLIAFIAVPAAFMLNEPSVKKITSRKFSENTGAILEYIVIKNRVLKWNIIISSIIGVATLIMAWLVQPLFVQFELPLSFYGIILPALNLTAGTVSVYAHDVENKFGFDGILAIIVIGIPFMYLAIGAFNNLWAIVFLFLLYIARGIAAPVLTNHLNRVTPSEIRATVLSVRNLVIRLAFVILSPLVGWCSDGPGLSAAMLSAGLFFLIAGVLAISRLINSCPSGKLAI